MSESFYNMSEQIRQWYDLEHYFDGILIFNLKKREAPSVYTFDESDVDDSDDLISRIEEAEKPYLPEVEAAIALIALSGEVDLDGFSLEALSVLRKRAETAAWFIHTLTTASTTLFPHPQCSMGDAVRWLLVDWWAEHGREMAADHEIVSWWTQRNV
ncbi:MAG: hypothetical protein QOH88_440 [Verrucomicrobiota bacterium]|jgi:hypothetical protein